MWVSIYNNVFFIIIISIFVLLWCLKLVFYSILFSDYTTLFIYLFIFLIHTCVFYFFFYYGVLVSILFYIISGFIYFIFFIILVLLLFFFKLINLFFCVCICSSFC